MPRPAPPKKAAGPLSAGASITMTEVICQDGEGQLSVTSRRACTEQVCCSSPFCFRNLCTMPSNLCHRLFIGHMKPLMVVDADNRTLLARPKTEIEKMKFMKVTPNVFGTVSPQRRSLA